MYDPFLCLPLQGSEDCMAVVTPLRQFTLVYHFFNIQASTILYRTIVVVGYPMFVRVRECLELNSWRPRLPQLQTVDLSAFMSKAAAAAAHPRLPQHTHDRWPPIWGNN
jgi:hypothetical protein